MSRMKVVLMALLATFALSAVAASSASADWFVEGALLLGLAKLASTAKVDQNASLLVVTGTTHVTVVCSGSVLSGVGAEIFGRDKGSATSLTFEGCSTTAPVTKCILTNQPTSIKTEPIEATATLGPASPEVRVTFKPKTKNLFASIPFDSSNTCALSAPEPVKGSVTIGAPIGRTESADQPIQGLGSVENNSLEVGAGNKAFISGGKALVRLETGEKWSFS